MASYPSYCEEEGWTTWAYRLVSGNVLRFCAQDVVRERTGIHAKLVLSLNWVSLAWSRMNIERDEDRVRLCNSAFARLDDGDHALDVKEFPKLTLKHHFDAFCLGLWTHVVGGQLGELMVGTEEPTARLLLDPFLVDGGGTILFAPPGEGKSYTAQAMAVSLTHGIDTIWRLNDTRQVTYVNLERSRSSMAARLGAVNRALGLPTDTPLPFLSARGRSLADIYEAAARTMELYGSEALVLDSISRTGVGDLTTNPVANSIIDMCNRLAPTWLALAHTPRADQSHLYGGIHFDAGADIVVRLTSQTSADGTRTGVGLKAMKANDTPLGGLNVHAFDWGPHGLVGISRASVSEFPELTLAEHAGIEELARQYLLMVGRATVSQIAAELGKDGDSVRRILKASSAFAYEPAGKQVLYFIKSDQMDRSGARIGQP